MRLFVAVELPGEVTALLGRLIEDLKGELGKLRWVRPERIHLTLKFLGEVAEPKVAELGRALARAVPGSVRPFELRVHGVGRFPPEGRPRVLWAGLQPARAEEAGALSALRERIEEAAAQAGFAREVRPFRPHLTLARLGEGRSPDGLADALARRVGAECGRIAVASVWLIQSVLGRGGRGEPEYRKLEEYRL